MSEIAILLFLLVPLNFYIYYLERRIERIRIILREHDRILFPVEHS